IHAAPGARLRKDPDIGISRHAVIGFAVLTADRPGAFAVGALLNDSRRADREAALFKDFLVPAAVDALTSPRADAGYFGILHIGVDIKASRAFAWRPKPTAVNLVLEKMPLSAVVEIDGSVV